MKTDYLQDILDGLTAVDMLCDNSTFYTPLAAISALYKVVYAYGTPVRPDFLSSYSLNNDKIEDRPFHMNMLLATLVRAKRRTAYI